MRLLDLAAALAFGGDRKRNCLLGAVIKRTDGAVVVATNQHTKLPEPSAHAEARVLKKSDWGCTLYVARVLKDGTWAMAKPCKRCQAIIRNRGVRRVYYTIGPNEFGIWDISKNKSP